MNARIIKIDIEGAEVGLIRGIKHLLGRFPEETEMIIELTQQAVEETGETISTIIDLFSQHGFSAYTIINDYSPYPYIRSGKPAPPTPFDGFHSGTGDMIFSKRPQEKVLSMVSDKRNARS